MMLLNARKTTDKGRKNGNSLSKCGNIMAITTFSSISAVYSILSSHKSYRVVNQNNKGWIIKMSKRIAIVEDDAAIRENYADVLRMQGYQVQTYANKSSAMRELWWKIN